MNTVNKASAFVKDAYGEMKKVQWPSKNETIRLTGYVIGVSLGVALFVTAFDYIFKGVLAFLVAK